MMAQQPEPAPMPTADAPPLRESEEEPGALLEVFARVEAEAETAQPSPAEDERKTA